MREETERAQPVVDRDDDNAVRRELRAVVVESAVLGEATAVEPDDDRQRGVAAQGRRADVQVEALLGLGSRRLKQVLRLRAARRVLARVANAVPCGRRLRRAPAEVSDRGCGV